MLKKLAAVGLAISIVFAPIAAMAKSLIPAPLNFAAAGGGANSLPPGSTAGGAAHLPIDRGAAMAAFRSILVSYCKKSDGPTGSGHIIVTLSPSGDVSKALIDGPPFAGSLVGACVAAEFRKTHIPPFAGSPIAIRVSFVIY